MRIEYRFIVGDPCTNAALIIFLAEPTAFLKVSYEADSVVSIVNLHALHASQFTFTDYLFSLTSHVSLNENKSTIQYLVTTT